MIAFVIAWFKLNRINLSCKITNLLYFYVINVIKSYECNYYITCYLNHFYMHYFYLYGHRLMSGTEDSIW